MPSQGHNHNGITTGYDITTEPYGDVTTGHVPGDIITTTTVPPEEIGRVFIIAMVCLGAGVLLVITAFIFTVLWCKKSSKTQHRRDLTNRSRIHTKYLEDYSLKTGGSPDDYTPTGSQRSGASRVFTAGNDKQPIISNNNNTIKAADSDNTVHQGGAADRVPNGDVAGSDRTLSEDGEGLNRDVADIRL